MKKNLFTIVCMAATLMFTSCATTKTKPYSPFVIQNDAQLNYTITNFIDGTQIVSNVAMPIVTESLEKELNRLNLLAQNTSAPFELKIDFTHYRMRPGAVRVLFGAWAGSDEINSSITLRNKSSGQIIGQYEVETSTAAAFASSEATIQEHVEEIVKQLKTAKGI